MLRANAKASGAGQAAGGLPGPQENALAEGGGPEPKRGSAEAVSLARPPGVFPNPLGLHLAAPALP